MTLLRKWHLGSDGRGDSCNVFPLAKELQRFSTILDDKKDRLKCYEPAILWAVGILASHDENDFLNRTFADPGKSRQLQRQLGFLTRIRGCFDTITITSDGLSLFKNVCIVPLEVPITQCQSGSLRDLDR